MTIVQANVDRVCSTCGATLPPGARKCSQCTSYQDECDTCGLPIPDNARRCPECKAFQNGRPCRSCSVPMPASAKRCPECKTLQNWRAHIPDSQVVLALLISLISVVSAVAPAAYRAWNNRSNTYVRILGPSSMSLDGDPNVPLLLVLVVNNGGRPSLVRRAMLVGDGLAIGETELKIPDTDSEQTIVLPSKTVTLRLSTTEITTTMKRKALLASLHKGKVKVVVEIDETGRLGGRYTHQQHDEMNGGVLANLVTKLVPLEE